MTDLMVQKRYLPFHYIQVLKIKERDTEINIYLEFLKAQHIFLQEHTEYWITAYLK